MITLTHTQPPHTSHYLRLLSRLLGRRYKQTHTHTHPHTTTGHLTLAFGFSAASSVAGGGGGGSCDKRLRMITLTHTHHHHRTPQLAFGFSAGSRAADGGSCGASDSTTKALHHSPHASKTGLESLGIRLRRDRRRLRKILLLQAGAKAKTPTQSAVTKSVDGPAPAYQR